MTQAFIIYIYVYVWERGVGRAEQLKPTRVGVWITVNVTRVPQRR